MSITIRDLQLAEQIIRICQARGAFQMEEMPQIIELHNKFTSILRQQQNDGTEEKSTPPPVNNPIRPVDSPLQHIPYNKSSFSNTLGSAIKPF